MPKKLLVLLLGALALVASVFSQGQKTPPGNIVVSPWPKFQCNSANTAQGIGRTANGLLLWSNTDLNDTFFGSSVVGADGTIYQEGANGGVYALHPNGSFSTSNVATDAFYGTPALDSIGNVYVGGSSGEVYKLSSTLAADWSFQTGDPIYGSPALGTDGTVYVTGQNGGVYALSSTGTLLWSYQTGEGNEGCPAIGSDGTIYVVGINGGVYAFVGGASGGSLLWSHNLGDNFLYGSAAFGSNGELYVVGQNGIYGLSSGPTGGGILWTGTVPNDYFVSSCAIDGNGIVYAEGGNGGVYAFGSGGGLLWSYQTSDTFNGSPAIASDGTIYAAGTNGGIYALSGGSSGGSLLWALATGDDFSYGSLAIGADGTVYSPGQDGGVYAVSAAEEITTLTLNPSSILSGASSTGTVNIAYPAPVGGWLINLSAGNSHVKVPASVTIPSGSTSATFTITTTQPTASFSSLITGTDSVRSTSATLQVYADYVTAISLNPSSISGGTSSTGTVTILEAAPAGGFVVNLACEYPQSVTVPAAVTVPAGATTGTFTITAGQFSNNFTCDIYASNGTAGKQARLSVGGDTISKFALSPSSIGCNQTSTGTVTLTSAAPATGWTVNISDQYPSSVSVPASITIPAGATSGSFTITPLKQSGSTFTCGIYVSDGHNGTQQTLQIFGDSLASVSFASSVVGGNPATGTVTLTSPAPPGGWIVNLSTEYPSVDGVPPTVTVPANATSATFTVTTKATGTTYGCGVYASDGNSGKQTVLTITHS